MDETNVLPRPCEIKGWALADTISALLRPMRKIREWNSVIVALLAALTACTPAPFRLGTTAPAYYTTVVGQPGIVDGRGRFRAILCGLIDRSRASGTERATCDNYLWKLSREPVPQVSIPLPKHNTRLRIVLVRAAFSVCFADAAIPFPEGIEKLKALGYQTEVIMVSGRSSSSHNAKQIAHAIMNLPTQADELLVLVGYSKGTVDILQFVGQFPDLASRVYAIVSVSGAINGSPLADRYVKLYDALLAKADIMKNCPPGDGGVVDSLTRERRLDWLGEQDLPSHIRYFSVVSFTSLKDTARILSVPWRELAAIDARNDGQLLAQDQVLPGSTLLGYVNADHWRVAIRIEQEFPFLAERPKEVAPFPREELLEAIVLQVAETVDQSRSRTK